MLVLSLLVNGQVVNHLESWSTVSGATKNMCCVELREEHLTSLIAPNSNTEAFLDQEALVQCAVVCAWSSCGGLIAYGLSVLR